jgi:hypothetical protein
MIFMNGFHEFTGIVIPNSIIYISWYLYLLSASLLILYVEKRNIDFNMLHIKANKSIYIKY